MPHRKTPSLISLRLLFFPLFLWKNSSTYRSSICGVYDALNKERLLHKQGLQLSGFLLEMKYYYS